MNLPNSLKLFFAFSLLTFASFASSQPPPPSPIELVQVKDDIYVITNPFVPGNITVLLTDEGIIMVDNKFAWDYDNVMEMIGTISDQPVVYVINTHFHADHTGGNERAQIDGTVVVASENARLKMIEANLPGLPDITLDEHAFVHLGGKVVEVFRFGRSHTDGDFVVYFPEHRVLATGDMFTYGDATPQLIDYTGGGSARAWTRTLDKALMLDFDTVIPGHGDVTNKTEMANFRDSTLRLRMRAQEIVQNGGSREDVADMLRNEFHWIDFLLDAGLDGLIAESR
jgi:cyclase